MGGASCDRLPEARAWGGAGPGVPRPGAAACNAGGGRPRARPAGVWEKGGRPPPPAACALLEGDAGEAALVVIGPRVIDALEVLHRALVVQRDQRAAVRAAILESA